MWGPFPRVGIKEQTWNSAWLMLGRIFLQRSSLQLIICSRTCRSIDQNLFDPNSFPPCNSEGSISTLGSARWNSNMDHGDENEMILSRTILVEKTRKTEKKVIHYWIWQVIFEIWQATGQHNRRLTPACGLVYSAALFQYSTCSILLWRRMLWRILSSSLAIKSSLSLSVVVSCTNICTEVAWSSLRAIYILDTEVKRYSCSFII